MNPQLLEMLGCLRADLPSRHPHHHDQADELADERKLAEAAQALGVDFIELAEHLETEDAAQEFFE